MARSIFTQEEINLLVESYPKMNYIELGMLFPNKTYKQIRYKITNLKTSGVKVLNKEDKRDIKFLNKLTSRSSYWWGFIMADGHISKAGIKIEVSAKDGEHINKLSNHISCNYKNRMVKKTGYSKADHYVSAIEIWNKKLAEKWIKTFEIENAKTYNPPNLSVFYNRDLFIYFFIGMVDGDGAIWVNKTRTYMRVELHNSWFNTLKKFSELLDNFYNIKSSVNLTNKGSVILTIGSRISLKLLNIYAQEVDSMKRKWEILDNLKILNKRL